MSRMELGSGQWSSSGHGMPGLAVRIRKKRLYCTSSPKVYADKPIFEAADWEKRKATYTTGIISKVGDHVIVLYFSGRKYAGGNLDEVLRKRAMDLGPPLQMCDALNQNYPKEFITIIINCLFTRDRDNNRKR